MEVTDTDSINIRSVIEYQLAAFKKDDAQGAFAFASPAIQAQFSTPRKFYAEVKVANPWYYEVSKCVGQYALGNLSDAFKAFFKKTKGLPRFKKKGRNDSFTLDGSIHVDHRQIKVPVIGWIKTYERLPHGVKPKSITIKRLADRWFISFKIETEPTPTLKAVDFVGVDLGVNHLATLSTGEVFDGAKSYKKYQKKLSRMQWLNRHKQIGSNNERIAQLKVARLHRKIANIRKDTLHKITTYISKNHAVVGIIL